MMLLTIEDEGVWWSRHFGFLARRAKVVGVDIVGRRGCGDWRRSRIERNRTGRRRSGIGLCLEFREETYAKSIALSISHGNSWSVITDLTK